MMNIYLAGKDGHWRDGVLDDYEWTLFENGVAASGSGATYTHTVVNGQAPVAINNVLRHVPKKNLNYVGPYFFVSESGTAASGMTGFKEYDVQRRLANMEAIRKAGAVILRLEKDTRAEELADVIYAKGLGKKIYIATAGLYDNQAYALALGDVVTMGNSSIDALENVLRKLEYNAYRPDFENSSHSKFWSRWIFRGGTDVFQLRYKFKVPGANHVATFAVPSKRILLDVGDGNDSAKNKGRQESAAQGWNIMLRRPDEIAVVADKILNEIEAA